MVKVGFLEGPSWRRQVFSGARFLDSSGSRELITDSFGQFFYEYGLMTSGSWISIAYDARKLVYAPLSHCLRFTNEIIYFLTDQIFETNVDIINISNEQYRAKNWDLRDITNDICPFLSNSINHYIVLSTVQSLNNLMVLITVSY